METERVVGSVAVVGLFEFKMAVDSAVAGRGFDPFLHAVALGETSVRHESIGWYARAKERNELQQRSR